MIPPSSASFRARWTHKRATLLPVLPPFARVILRALRVIPDWAKKVLKAWLTWFWHLGTTGKVVMTGVEIVLLWFAANSHRLPLSSVQRAGVVQFGSVGLCFLCIAGIMFGRSRG